MTHCDASQVVAVLRLIEAQGFEGTPDETLRELEGVCVDLVQSIQVERHSRLVARYYEQPA